MFQLLQQTLSTIFHFLTAGYFQQTAIPSLDSRTMRNIVILGGSYAGINTAHRILKQAGKTGNFKVVLVTPNSHMYWSMASARGLVPGQLSDEQLFRPIAYGFKQYPVCTSTSTILLCRADPAVLKATQFEIILATAKSVNVVAKKVGISSATGSGLLDYDFLIVATGSHAKADVPYKSLGSTEHTTATLHDFQARVMKAKTIVVAGGGVTGCETAGELAYEYGRQKEIIFVGLFHSLSYFSTIHTTLKFFYLDRRK
jgi:NADH dehydrogenase FAD-containing subunit